MAFLYEYMTPDELEYAQESARTKLEMVKIDHAFDRVMMEHELRLKNIDLMSVVERYTETDLEDAYTKELSEFTEGVKDAWESFKAWVKKIIDAILGKSKQIPEIPEEKKKLRIKLPFDIKAVLSAVKEAPSKVKTWVMNNKGAAAVSFSSLAIAGFSIIMNVNEIGSSLKNFVGKFHKETEVTVDYALSAKQELIECSNNLSKTIDDFSNEKPDIKASLQKLFGPILKLVDDVVNAIKSAIAKLGETVKVAADNQKARKAEREFQKRQNAKQVASTMLPGSNPDKVVDAKYKDVKESSEDDYTFEDMFNEMLSESTTDIESNLDEFLESVTESDIEGFEDLLNLI